MPTVMPNIYIPNIFSAFNLSNAKSFALSVARLNKALSTRAASNP